MAGVDILASAFSGANAAFLGEQYARWAADPRSVDPTFAELFGALNDDARAVLEDATGASWAPRHPEFEDEVRAGRRASRARRAPPAPLSGEQIRAATIASLRALMLIRSYRVRGHLEARLDPLGLQIPRPHAELDPRSYGFTDADLDQPIFIDNVLGRETATLREIQTILRETYCGSIGVEFMHIQDPDQKSWIQRKVEGAPWRTAFDAAGEAHHPAAADRGRRLRGVLPEALRHHQALRPGRRRGHHPGAARHHRDGGRAGRARDRHRHAASRPAEHAGQHREEAAHRGVLRIRRRELQAGRRAGLGRREIPSRHLDRRGDRRPQRASVAAAQSVAPGGGRSGGDRQGARAPGQGGRHAARGPR